MIDIRKNIKTTVISGLYISWYNNACFVLSSSQ